MKRRILALMMGAVLAISMTACGGGDSAESSSESAGEEATADASAESGSEEGGSGEYKISIILKTLSAEYWNFVKAGCDAYAAENPGVSIDVKGPTSETAFDEQQNMIETDLNSGAYDAFIISPLQADTVTTLISGEEKPIIALDTDIDAPEVLTFVGTGNENAAAMGGEAGGTFLADETQYADAVADKAVTSMEAIMQNHPEGVAIICANNDDMAIAAARAAAGNAAYENTIFLGFNGDKTACEAILADELDMSVAQEAYNMGYLSVQEAVKALEGEELEEFTDSGCDVVTSENAQERLDTLNSYLE